MASGRIERRLVAAIVLTALIPLMGAVYLAYGLVYKTFDPLFVPEIGTRLDEALGLYQDLARAEKSAMKSDATAIAEQADVVLAAAGSDPAALDRVLRAALVKHPGLVSLSALRGDRKIGAVDRGRPVDDARELTLEVRRPIGRPTDDVDDDGAALVAVFAADRARYEDGLTRMSEFVSQYATVAGRRQGDERTYLWGFAGLLGLSMIAAIAVGVLLARSVSTRIVRLAETTRRVGGGDLTTRADESGADEVGDLARAFNRMLAEIEATRARIEYLQRIGAWQEMARRLAHEIKNPLTPIQLAVEEVHERYAGDDGAYRKLLDATLEVVEAEVGTLRRLVGEFSDFARLPQARLSPGDLAAFLREQTEQALLPEEGSEEDRARAPRITVAFDVPERPAPAHLDRQMLRRALINLIRNSAQAIRDQGRKDGQVRVSLGRSGDFWVIDVDDDGPGIPAESRERIFDPYVTTKQDGTGLGLAIVKKVIVEHGGVISAQESPLGGARVRITIPSGGTAPAAAVLEAGAAMPEALAAAAPEPSVSEESA